MENILSSEDKNISCHEEEHPMPNDSEKMETVMMDIAESSSEMPPINIEMPLKSCHKEGDLVPNDSEKMGTVEMDIAGSSSEMPQTNIKKSSKFQLPLTPLRNELLNFLSESSEAHFKSQQMNEPELAKEAKKLIAEELLDHSPAQFLGRYGQFMKEEHLQYFLDNPECFKEESYEIDFYLKQLKRFHCKATHDVDVKNRRYDAMKKMIAEGHSYFSEDEMRQRNPYLYEQLVGRYLSEEERREKELPDMQNITFVNLLLTKISRDETIELRKRQEREENGIEDISSCENSESEGDHEYTQIEMERGTWGETPDKKISMMHRRKRETKQKTKAADTEPIAQVEISEEERLLLLQEFVSSMHNSFIDGKDIEFDYSQVDSNPNFDCVDYREKDEEEKYFDEDSGDNMLEVLDSSVASANPPSPKVRQKLETEEEDALDAFMKTVSPSGPTSDLTLSFENLCRQSKFQPQETSRFKQKHVIKFNLKK